jgi:hypothetical protein
MKLMDSVGEDNATRFLVKWATATLYVRETVIIRAKMLMGNWKRVWLFVISCACSSGLDIIVLYRSAQSGHYITQLSIVYSRLRYCKPSITSCYSLWLGKFSLFNGSSKCAAV